GAPVSTDTELGGYVREFEMRVRQDTNEIYMRLDDEQTKRQLLAGQLNMLFRDRRAHAYTRQLIETEARMSREAWDKIVETLLGAPVSTDTELGGYVREFETRVRQDTYEIYKRSDVRDQEVVGRRSQETDCDFKVTEDRS
nr:hypothetical protein [Tanacetum cinerariifolium]